MARKKAGRRKRSRGAGSLPAEKLYSLTDLARKAGVSLPTAQRYKKLYQSRIPSQGTGRKQRYPEEAIKVFEEIKKESLARRGRSRTAGTSAPEKGRKKAARRVGKRAVKKTARRVSKAPTEKAGGRKLLTLTEISRRTGISYPTCVSYVKRFGDRIPHVGEGRKRRFPVAAVAVFKDLRSKSRRGRRRKVEAGGPRPRRAPATGAGSVAARMRRLQRSQANLLKELRALRKELAKPLRLIVKR